MCSPSAFCVAAARIIERPMERLTKRTSGFSKGPFDVAEQDQPRLARFVLSMV